MEVSEKIIKIIADQLNKDASEISRDQELVQDLGADSLDAVEIIMNIEEEFNIEIPEEEASKIKTVGEIIDVIEKL
ncbi:MAG: acyl carrier protein [Clostridia bacterium]|nr:acyl carrier protein [Clostridia bacterium]